MKLTIEKNQRNCLDVQLNLPSHALLMITAPLQEDCWLFRMRLGKNLFLTARPVFGGVNICLQPNDTGEWQMPYESEPEKIAQTFRPRTKDYLSASKCRKAIKELQDQVKNWRGVAL